MASPKRTRINDTLLKQFAEGRLDSEIEVKLALAIEKSPELQARVAAVSNDGFLDKVKHVAVASRSARSDTQSNEITEVSVALKQPEGIPQELIESPDYQVLKELGRGGMGVVYAAKYLPMDRMEVLKVLNPQMVQKESARQRFINEMKAIGKLNHPFIATAYQRVVLPTQLVFSMEYVPGRDLHKYIQQYHPIPVPVACTLACQIAIALQYAHARKMVHRDIKPSNVMVYEEDSRRQIKILDFGLAKATSEQEAEGLTADGMMLGTPEYMAPEQALNAATADIRADIYSFGCTLYHLLVGTPPFTGTYQSVLMAHAEKDAAFINVQRPEVPVELAQIVATMMAKEPSKRFQTPKAVVSALKPFTGTAKINPSQQKNEAEINTRNHLASPSRDTSVEGRTHRNPTKRVPRKRSAQHNGGKKPRTIAIIAGGSFAALILFGILISLRTQTGTLVIENLPPDAQVTVDQEDVELRWNDGKDSATVRIKAGTRQVEVLSGGVTIAGETVTIESGAKSLLTVTLERNSASEEVAVRKPVPLPAAELTSSEPSSHSVPIDELNLATADSKKPTGDPASLLSDKFVSEAGGTWGVPETLRDEWSRRQRILQARDPSYFEINIEHGGNAYSEESWRRNGDLLECVGPINGNNSFFFFGDSTWQAYDLSCDFRFFGGGGATLLASVREKRFWWVANRRNSLEPISISIHAKVPGKPFHSGPGFFQDSNFVFEEGRWYRLRLVIRGNSLQYYVENTLIAERRHSDLEGGSVGLMVHKGTEMAQYRNLSIVSPTGDLLWAGFPRIDAPDVTHRE